MVDVSDLIGCPFRENGRTRDGFDCYGLALEVERRFGKELADVVYSGCDQRLADEFAPLLNIRRAGRITAGTLIEMRRNGEVHVGVALDGTRMIHATVNQGVRISRIGSVPVTDIWEVI